ncbi:hypothetical protein [Prescottella agglutinans]|uniref:hypothetical protein n=1 Tax=Prescottella agglutinans TaxID=1644129 RepID=UPI003D98D087
MVGGEPARDFVDQAGRPVSADTSGAVSKLGKTVATAVFAVTAHGADHGVGFTPDVPRRRPRRGTWTTFTLTPQQNPLPLNQVRVDDPGAQQKLIEETRNNLAGATVGSVVGALIWMDIRGGPLMRQAPVVFITP